MTYHVEAEATNELGTVKSGVQPFITDYLGIGHWLCYHPPILHDCSLAHVSCAPCSLALLGQLCYSLSASVIHGDCDELTYSRLIGLETNWIQ